ncbi:uncharacterized protein LOC109604352 [Aethina tumida]|uniref:uncharacterized protein LOC109604352 n=1 Tax=Aethina tumida TaxID=116153 RepID=UPI00096AF74F|nr:uncharacterized protein LOC109604352 [Aethina tumida]
MPITKILMNIGMFIFYFIFFDTMLMVNCWTVQGKKWSTELDSEEKSPDVAEVEDYSDVDDLAAERQKQVRCRCMSALKQEEPLLDLTETSVAISIIAVIFSVIAAHLYLTEKMVRSLLAAFPKCNYYKKIAIGDIIFSIFMILISVVTLWVTFEVGKPGECPI